MLNKYSFLEWWQATESILKGTNSQQFFLKGYIPTEKSWSNQNETPDNDLSINAYVKLCARYFTSIILLTSHRNPEKWGARHNHCTLSHIY